MTNAQPSLSPILHEIQVNVVSAEEASVGVAEFWAGDELFGFTLVEDGDFLLRIEPKLDGAAVVVSAHRLAEAIAEATRLLRQEVSR
ncbi:MAG TPA: hypothetical protein VF056_09480 [Thermoleophilaceae bacterium]